LISDGIRARRENGTEYIYYMLRFYILSRATFAQTSICSQNPVGGERKRATGRIMTTR